MATDELERLASGAVTSRSGARWHDAYAHRLVVSDAVCVTLAVGLAYVVRFDVSGLPVVAGSYSPSYLSVALVLALAWMAGLTLMRTRDRRIVGSGPAEYGRVFGATWRLFAFVAITAYALKMDIGRGFLAFAAPLGLGLLLLTRYAWRHSLHRARARDDCLSTMLVVGHPSAARRLVAELHRNPSAGYRVVGVCVPRGEPIGDVDGVPVLGTVDETASVALRVGVSAVAVTGSDSITADSVRTLAWDLEGHSVDMAVALALTDVAGPRVIMQPVNGLPLMYVDEPRFTGGKYVAKSLFDYLGAGVLAVLLLPLMAVVAVVVATTSRGPVFYTQERIGRDGRPFGMLKFRSMVVDAHDQLADVLRAEGTDGVTAFYKPADDPRVTRVGRVLRRYSLDELPQLFNVLRGDMSLVGPRPQIAAEVAHYDRTAHRRLLVRPGLTGLWQVSGRSELSPEQAIRMDVMYVENWTLFGDVLILARTLRVVLVGEGAR